MRAWSCSVLGIDIVIAAETRGKAAYAVLRGLSAARYDYTYIEIRHLMIRSPLWDAWAASQDKTTIEEESNVDKCPKTADREAV